MTHPKETDSPEQLYTVKQASNWRNVARNTWLREWQEGVWPDPVVIRGKRYWLKAELEAALRDIPRVSAQPASTDAEMQVSKSASTSVADWNHEISTVRVTRASPLDGKAATDAT